MNTHNQEPGMTGRRLSHYRVVSLLGSGGMGAVYLGHDDRLNRSVALKMLRPDLPMDPDRMQRFVREAEAASALNHPNVATIYDVGEDAGVRFIAMEYVEGQTLAAKIVGRPLETNEILDIGIQIAEALDAAHDKGITHRDVKPGNVMITDRGQVKILDFGLAKMRPSGVDASASTATALETRAGVVLGSLPYMSPEQVLGRDVDHRSDIFSLGTTLYEMATGRLPFRGAAAGETMDGILHRPPDSITQLNARAPVELERIVRKCLEKDRNRRYSTARELLVDLRTLQRDTGSVLDEHRERPLHRNRWWMPTVVAAALVLVVAAGGVYRLSSPAPMDSILVLPFANNSGNADADALSDGIPETLINILSRLPKLQVISRPTAFGYRGKSDLKQIASDLHVGAVLTGRLVQRGDTLNLQVELTDAATGNQLWGDQFVTTSSEILTVQDTIVTKITEGLHLQLGPDEELMLAKHHTNSPQAYQFYLQGRHLARQLTKDGFDKGLDRFRQALAIDEHYALAYAGMAEAYLTASDLFIPAREAGPQAKDNAIKARAADDSLSEAHCVMAAVSANYDWDWKTADAEYRKARELDPSSPCVNDAYGAFLAALGRFDQAMPELKRELQLDEHNYLRHFNLGQAFYYQREFGKAIEEFNQVRDLEPGFWFVKPWLAVSYQLTGRSDQAFAEVLGLPDEFRDADVFRVILLAFAGRKGEAIRLLEQETSARPQKASPWGLAGAYATLGDRDRAFEELQKAHDEHFVIFFTFKVDPLFSDLRSDRRFDALIRSTGL